MVLVVEIKAVPGSGRQLCKREGNRLKCYLKSPPQKGKANKELIKMLAKAVRLTQDNIEFVSGQTSRLKQIRIKADISFDKLCEMLGIEKQLTLF